MKLYQEHEIREEGREAGHQIMASIHGAETNQNRLVSFGETIEISEVAETTRYIGMTCVSVTWMKDKASGLW